MKHLSANPTDRSPPTNWSVYIIRCADGSLYTGITTDPGRRFQQHADGRGAKFFRTRRPLEIVYREEDHSRSTAGKREIEIKGMTKKDKAALVGYGSNTLTGTQD